MAWVFRLVSRRARDGVLVCSERPFIHFTIAHSFPTTLPKPRYHPGDGRTGEATRKLRKKCSPHVPERYPWQTWRASKLSRSCRGCSGSREWPKFDQTWPMFPKIWPHLANVGLLWSNSGPNLTNVGQHPAKLGRNSAKLGLCGQTRPNLDRLCAGLFRSKPVSF